jgi:hypothetical protein
MESSAVVDVSHRVEFPRSSTSYYHPSAGDTHPSTGPNNPPSYRQISPPPSAGLQTPPSDPHTYPPPQNTAAAIPSENLITEEAAEVEAHRASLEQKSRFPGCLPKVLPYLCGWDGER